MRSRVWLVALVASVAGLASACLPPDPPPPDPPPPPLISVSTYVSGLAIPWDVAFTPDGRMLYTERAGGIRVFDAGVKRSLVGGTPIDLFVGSEAGMLGLALDPGFAGNRRVYACFASTAPGGGVLDVRVARFTVDAGYTALSNRTDIVTGIPVNATGQAGRHSGCRPRFGPDGDLWIGTGDAATGTAPQDRASLGGKVLRVDTNGTAAPGNAGSADVSVVADPRVFTYGHRNVQGLAFRPGSGTPYSVEHGTGCDDELNRLVAGGNYGWDPVPVPPDPGTPPGYSEAGPMTDLVKFPGAVRAVWSSGCPTIAPSGSTFLTGSQWGDWDGALAVAVLKGSQLRIMKLDPAGTTVVDQVITLTDYGRLRTPVQGPDGALYVTTANGANDLVLRVTRG